MEYPEHESVPDAGRHVLENEHTSPGDSSRFLKAGLHVLGVMQHKNQQDNVEAVVVEGKPLAVEQGQPQIGFVEVLDIDRNDFAADSSLQQLVQSAITGADVQDAIVGPDEWRKMPGRPAGAVKVYFFFTNETRRLNTYPP